jgi:bacterioferritin-associated ferredoxin
VIVCICNRLTENDVRRAVRNGASTPERTYACLGCEVQCGCCLDYAREIIEDERFKRPRLLSVAA